MELLIFIALIVIFIIVLNIQGRQQTNQYLLKKDLEDLTRELRELKKVASASPENPAVNIFDAAQKEAEQKEAEQKAAEEHKDRIAAIGEAARLRKLRIEEAARVEGRPSNPEENIRKTLNEQPLTSAGTAKEGMFSKWARKNPDLEKFIGENLVSKIGIAVLVLAIAFFVKYAIDKDWVGPAGRVSIGILCGVILVAVAHRLRNTYRAFSSVLAGGGIAVFYFTITLGFHQFQLFSQTTAFIIMIVITAFAVALALLYDKQELAVIALVGGFAAPFLVSTGAGNYKVLFIYLIVLNSGLLVIAYNKAWRLLNLLSFIFTALLFGSWLFNLSYSEPHSTYSNGFLFATIFYLIYFAINIAHNIRERKKFIASDFGILLGNTALFFTAGLYCLHHLGGNDLRGLFSAAMAVFNLAASYFFFRKQKVDINILYLLIGITLTFISVTAPLQLAGNFITVFWASEAVLLYWLYFKSSIKIIRLAAMAVWLLMFVSLVLDLVQIYLFELDRLPVIFNKGFITTVFSALATYALFFLSRKEPAKSSLSPALISAGKTSFRITAIVLLFLAGFFEINFQFRYYYPQNHFNILWLLLYTIVFISLLTFISQKIKRFGMSAFTAVLFLSACLFLYLFAVSETFNVQRTILEAQQFKMQFVSHWLTAILTGSVFVRLISLIRRNDDLVKDGSNFLTWALCSFAVIFLSAEIHLISNDIFYGSSNSLADIQRVYIKTGLPILWGLCSFAFMWLGMRYKIRTLRIISLSLFMITLLKLFIFDIRNIPAGGKIAAFFSLGVLLLVVSFMYQRLKKIIIDDEKNNN